MSPAVGAFGSPWIVSTPASQYTNAGMMLKIVPTTMKNQRPTSEPRNWRAASLAFARRKRRIDSSCWPNVLARRMPLTDSVSSVIAETSARDFWVSSVTSRRMRPTR